MLNSTTQSRTSLPTAFVVGRLVLSREKYPCNTIQVQTYKPTNAQTVKSVMIALTGRSLFEVPLEDAKLSINFRFKVLNTLQNNMSRIFKIVLFNMHLQTRKLACFSLCNIIKIYLLVFQFKTTLNFTCLLTIAVKHSWFKTKMISSQRTDLIRQKSFNFLKKCFKSKLKFLIFQM